MKCKYCGAEVPDGSKFCPSCGKDLSNVRKCVKCGEIIDDDATFCPHCGAEQPLYDEKKSNMPKILVVVFLVIAAIGVGAWYFLSHQNKKTGSILTAPLSKVVKEKVLPMKAVTFVISDGQPPIVGGQLNNPTKDHSFRKGIAFSSNKDNLSVTANTNFEVPTDCSADYNDTRYFDCTEGCEEQWTASIRYLPNGGTYYVRAFVIDTQTNKVTYGNIETVQVPDFRRNNSQTNDYANVWYSEDYDLFDLKTDELIDNTYYYSTNENPDDMGIGQKGTYNTCYKFRTKYSYRLWHPGRSSLALPIMTYKNGKVLVENAPNSGFTFRYAINDLSGDPDDFSTGYNGGISVQKGDVVICYFTDESGDFSYLNWYKVL